MPKTFEYLVVYWSYAQKTILCFELEAEDIPDLMAQLSGIFTDKEIRSILKIERMKR